MWKLRADKHKSASGGSGRVVGGGGVGGGCRGGGYWGGGLWGTVGVWGYDLFVK